MAIPPLIVLKNLKVGVLFKKTEYKVKGGYFLDVVAAEGATSSLKRSGEDQTLLVGWDGRVVVDRGNNVVDCVGRIALR